VRFVTFTEDSGHRAGRVVDDVVHPLPTGTSQRDLLGDDGKMLREAGELAVQEGTAARPVDALHLAAPIPDPPTVRDFMTFESHFAGALLVRGPDAEVPPEWYQNPAFYFTNPYAILGPADPVPIAPGSSLFDLELEIGAVIGRVGRDLTPDEAWSYIAGYTILVDWSARDLQLGEMAVGLGPAKAKDTATTLGPALVTADELEPFRSGTSFALDMTAEINGRRLGSDRMDNMAWSFGDMVAYASRGTEVRPGDILGSGTCGGGCLVEMWGRHGFAHHPPLQPGDRVTVTVEQLGTLDLEVVSGAEPVPIGPVAR
jgi:2-keto-4-pentenoate hydratase/2-oxohepta-3-ene-1,7-dioic acid hydratase in catechol pathway